MNASISEEGDVSLYVCPDAATNAVLAQHFSQDCEGQTVKLQCSDRKTRDLWRVDLELLGRLAARRPKLQFEVYRQVNGNKPRKVALDYALRGNVGETPRLAPNDPKRFPETKDESPF